MNQWCVTGTSERYDHPPVININLVRRFGYW